MIKWALGIVGALTIGALPVDALLHNSNTDVALLTILLGAFTLYSWYLGMGTDLAARMNRGDMRGDAAAFGCLAALAAYVGPFLYVYLAFWLWKGIPGNH